MAVDSAPVSKDPAQTMELLVRGSMAKPKTPIWEADEQTLAKHAILREYL